MICNYVTLPMSHRGIVQNYGNFENSVLHLCPLVHVQGVSKTQSIARKVGDFMEGNKKKYEGARVTKRKLDLVALQT